MRDSTSRSTRARRSRCWANGAGKSTTIDMLLGLTRPDSGRVWLLGRDPRAAVEAGLVGAMLQVGGQLVRDLTVRELVSMVASLYPAPLDVGEALEIAGVADIAGPAATEKLSGGQTERVALPLARVSEPELLVLAEPTVAMDVEGRRGFWTAMRAFAARGKTVVFATHYLDEADDHADRAVLMAHERFVADGPTAEIKARAGRRIMPRDAPRRPRRRGRASGAVGRREGGRASRRRGDRCAAPTPTRRAARCSLRTRPCATARSSSAGLEAAFLTAPSAATTSSR